MAYIGERASAVTVDRADLQMATTNWKAQRARKQGRVSTVGLSVRTPRKHPPHPPPLISICGYHISLVRSTPGDIHVRGLPVIYCVNSTKHSNQVQPF